MHSPVGAVWDITADRLVECTVILGLFGCDPISRAWLTALMLSSVLLCVTSFLVVGIFSRNTSEKSFHYSPGLIERAEALICWSITILWPSTYFFLSYLFTSLVCLTAVIRLWQFSRIQGGSGKRAP
jgi:phosphatidylglycerophosphate synthase